MLRTYGYDAFGNRTHMTEGDRETAYTYNAMNQLMSRMDSMSEETYAYDRRGNLSLIMENGSLKNSYTYGALNRLEQAMNGNGEAAAYEYNGLGHRVGKVIGIMKGLDGSYPAAQSMDIPDPMGSLKEQNLNPETKIRYTIDLTRGYHNLLEKEEAGSRQTYLWDGNVAGMREEKNGQNGWSNLSNHPDTAYYLQDELGSPIRLLDEEGNMRETYGYDEFGQDLYRNQGQIQPFGYTGYQSDRIAGTYYAQAREYRAELGRFAGVDIIKGFAEAPYTLNEYGYCWGNPMVLVDLDGAWPKWIETAAKVVTVTVAVAAVAGAIVATGGAAVALGIVAGAAVGGVANGLVNEANGGSYINGWAGGALSGEIQALGGIFGPVTFVLGGAANGLGSMVTDRLDNIDPTNNKYKTNEEILEDARTNAIKGMAYSIPGALMGWFTNFANASPSVVNGLMKGYNNNFGESLNQFYGIIDNLLLGEDSLDEKNNRTCKD